MKITKQALRDNGWKDAEMSFVFPVLWKSIRKSDGYTQALDLAVFLRPTHIEVKLDFHIPLPRITSMEVLAQLEYLLGDTALGTSAVEAAYPVVKLSEELDKLKILEAADHAIERQFGSGGPLGGA